MGKMTFVVDFPDGQEPAVSAATNILGGKLLSVAFKDATQCDDLLSRVRFSLQCGAGWRAVLEEVIEERGWNSTFVGSYHETLFVPKVDIESAKALVREIVPVTYKMDVGVDSQ